VATITSLLRDRVTLRVRSVDRLFLQAYVPKLMTAHQVVRFLLDRGFAIPSPTLLAKQGRAYVAAIDRYAAEHEIPIVRFAKDDSKEEVARPYLEHAERVLDHEWGPGFIKTCAYAPRVRGWPSRRSTTASRRPRTRNVGRRSALAPQPARCGFDHTVNLSTTKRS